MKDVLSALMPVLVIIALGFVLTLFLDIVRISLVEVCQAAIRETVKPEYLIQKP
jgi:hypothetical protein